MTKKKRNGGKRKVGNKKVYSFGGGKSGLQEDACNFQKY